MRVLIVDDEPSVRMTIAANVELEGLEVIEAGDAQSALAELEQCPVDLVLTDIRMPGMHGVDLFREIRRRWPEIPVVLMTAFAAEGLVQDVMAEGAFTVLQKPFDVEHAVTTLGRALRRPTVLVVDDDHADASTIAEALRSVSLPADAAADASSALDVLRQGHVDVCVVDLVLPGQNGAELIRQIRERDPSILVIAISGRAVPDMMQSAMTTGAGSCMRKPFDPRELLQTIARLRGTGAAPGRCPDGNVRS